MTIQESRHTVLIVEDLNYLLKLINRLQKNHTTKVLVVDDSASVRLFIMNLLRLRKYQAFEAEC